MKKIFLLFMLFAVHPFIKGQDLSGLEIPYKKFNFGAKIGFTSAIYLTTHFDIDGTRIVKAQNNYKVGYTGSLFMRYNFKAHYIQPEIAYTINRCEVYFEKPDFEQGTGKEFSTLRSELHSIDIPILYGYNFIKEDIYGMSFFIGPKIRYILEGQSDMDYSNFDQKGITERFHRFNLGFTGGVAVYLSKIFFDFRYEQFLQNISKKASYDKELTPVEDQKNLRLHRRDHVLSFSLGFMF